MEAQQHQGKALQYLTIHPDGYNPDLDYPMVILLHGFGANMQDLANLCPVLDRTGYVYVCPNAPLAFELGPGMTGYGWTPRGHGTEEDAHNAQEMLESTFQEVMEEYRVQPGKSVLMGFSQGGGMTYRCGLPRPDTFAGIGALSAVVPAEDEIRPKLPPQRDQSIFIAHGTYDQLISVDRSRAAKVFLEGEGYSPQYKEYSMAHEISKEVMDDLVPWLKGVLPPLGDQVSHSTT